MTQDQVIFGQPSFDDREIELVTQVMRSRWIGQGPVVEQFERSFAAAVRASYAVAVSSCTAALEIALRAIGVGPGDEVITTPMTFVATPEAIEACGAAVRFVDIDADTLLITPDAVAAAITPKTRAIMPVSFGGFPIDVAGYRQLLDRHDLWLVEDAAHSVGAVGGGEPVGADRHPRWLTCFSFYPNKNLASAEGGAITTVSSDLADVMRSIRLHGLEIDAWQRYRTNEYRPSLAIRAGLKANWTDLQAAIALVQLDKLDGFLATREYLASEYDDMIRDHEAVQIVERPPTTLAFRHGLHLYQVRIHGSLRDEVVSRMRAEGIGAAVHYIGVNQHPRFQNKCPQDVPNSDRASAELVSLPLHPALHTDDLERVVMSLIGAVHAARSA